MNINALFKQKIVFLVAAAVLVSGCAFRKPDYVNMISAAELNRIMQDEDIVLIDVHIPRQRHIKGTRLFIPYNEIERHADKLPAGKDTAIYLYCEGGPMGNAAARALHALGYRNLSNLEGGAKAWRAAGFEFE